MEIFTTDTACGIRDGEKLWVVVAANTVYPTWLGDIPVLFPRLAAPATDEESKLPENIRDESAQCRALRETPSSTVYVAVDAVPRLPLTSNVYVTSFQEIVSVTFQLLAGMYIASTHYGLIHGELSRETLYVKKNPLERRQPIEFAIGSYLYRVPQVDPLVYTLDLSRAETVTRPMPSADGMGRVTRDLRAIGTIMSELMEDNRGSLSPLEWNALESLRSRLTVDADTLLLAPTITSTQQSSPYLLHLSHYLFFERHIVGPTREVQWTDAPPLWVAPQDAQRLEHLQIAMQVRDRGKQWTREELEKMTRAELYQEFKFLFPAGFIQTPGGAVAKYPKDYADPKLRNQAMRLPDILATVTTYLGDEAKKRELERKAEEARIRAEQEEEEARRAREAERKAAEEAEQARIRAEREETERAEERERIARAEREREEAEAARAAQDAEETEDTVVQAGGLPPQLLAGIIPVQGNWQRCVQEMVDVAKEPPQDSADVFRGQANTCLQLIHDLFSSREWTDVDEDTKEFLQQLSVITAQGKLVQVTKTGKFRIRDDDPLGNAFQAAYVLLGLTTIATAIRPDIAAGSPWINSNLSEIKELKDRIDAVPDDTYQRDLPVVVEELVAGIPFLKKGKQEEEEDKDQTPPLSPREQQGEEEETVFEEEEDQTPPLSPREEETIDIQDVDLAQKLRIYMQTAVVLTTSSLPAAKVQEEWQEKFSTIVDDVTDIAVDHVDPTLLTQLLGETEADIIPNVSMLTEDGTPEIILGTQEDIPTAVWRIKRTSYLTAKFILAILLLRNDIQVADKEGVLKKLRSRMKAIGKLDTPKKWNKNIKAKVLKRDLTLESEYGILTVQNNIQIGERMGWNQIQHYLETIETRNSPYFCVHDGNYDYYSIDQDLLQPMQNKLAQLLEERNVGYRDLFNVLQRIQFHPSIFRADLVLTGEQDTRVLHCYSNVASILQDMDFNDRGKGVSQRKLQRCIAEWPFAAGRTIIV